MLQFTAFLALWCISPSVAEYVDWRTFKANGVNLGGWLVQEPSIDTAWWNKYSGGAQDEWGLCENLGQNCGPVLEERYSTFITTDDIDLLGKAGVKILRIPTTYAAWIKLPGSQLYSGNQKAYFQNIATYAITKYGMHIVLDLHSLPGGVNGLTTGEALFHWGWYNNETAFEYTMQAVDAAIDFIQTSGHPQSYSLAPINEPCDNKNLLIFGTAACLTDSGVAWVLKYIHAVLDRLAKVNPHIPVMFQGSFKGEAYWSGSFSEGTNIVFDVHNYYFEGRPTTSQNLPQFICEDAKASPGDGKFPVIVGEWAIAATLWNSLALRKRNLNVGIWAFGNWTQGSMMWTAKHPGNNFLLGEGTEKDYWSFETFINLGYLDVSEGHGYC